MPERSEASTGMSSATTTRVLRIGTRASALARTQTGLVVDALARPVEVDPIVTQGDRSPEALTRLGGTGVFVSALRTALYDGEIDVAVHSFKDLPTLPAVGIAVAAVPLREDPRDALVARDGLTLAELPRGARIGTGSPRRAAQLRALGLDLEVLPIRGNVDTRLGRVGASDGPADLDAVVLACAGLRRLGRADAITELLDPIQMLPAPAQGALAIECRGDDAEALGVLAALDDADTRTAVGAERALLQALEAGCAAPVGALADIAEGDEGAEVFLRATVV